MECSRETIARLEALTETVRPGLFLQFKAQLPQMLSAEPATIL